MEMSMNERRWWGVGMIVLALLCLMAGWTSKPATQIQEVEVVKYVEVVNEQMFDTSILETLWCGGFDDGTVRMIGAWKYADGVVQDEQGQLWGIDQQVSEEDFLLLWIADNNTPDNVLDDVIIKVWREAY